MPEVNFMLVNMILAEGSPNILQELNKGRGKQFKDFIKLVNPRTNNFFSPNTITRRVKELTSIGAMKETIIKGDKGKSVIGYVITQKGKQALQISEKYEKVLQAVFSKQ